MSCVRGLDLVRPHVDDASETGLPLFGAAHFTLVSIVGASAGGEGEECDEEQMKSTHERRFGGGSDKKNVTPPTQTVERGSTVRAL